MTERLQCSWCHAAQETRAWSSTQIPLSLWPSFSQPGIDVQVRLYFAGGQLWEGKMFTDVLASFYVNLTKARFILEEGISIEKNVPNRLAGGAFS